jgi:N-acyl-phosphatidylethanolamine-hydrolysing phospholipase D
VDQGAHAIILAMRLTDLSRLAILCLSVAIAGCGSATGTDKPSPARDQRQGAPRHDGKFQNNYLDFQPKSLASLLRWRYEAWRAGVPKPPQQATPRVPADLRFIHDNARAGRAMEPALTWIGHASVLAQIGGINVLLDPIFSERASPLSSWGRSAHPTGLLAAQLPRIDAVLVSHNTTTTSTRPACWRSPRRRAGRRSSSCRSGLKTWLAERGIANAVELDWWQSARIGEVDIVLTPAQHWSSRSLGDRMETLWGSFALFGPDFHLFYSGDTGYSKDFADIHARFETRHGAGRGFDAALIAIGAYEPRWFMREQHIDADEAVRITSTSARAPRSACIGAPSSSPTSRSTSRRRRSREPGVSAASPTTPSASWLSARRGASRSARPSSAQPQRAQDRSEHRHRQRHRRLERRPGRERHQPMRGGIGHVHGIAHVADRLDAESSRARAACTPPGTATTTTAAARSARRGCAPARASPRSSCRSRGARGRCRCRAARPGASAAGSRRPPAIRELDGQAAAQSLHEIRMKAHTDRLLALGVVRELQACAEGVRAEREILARRERERPVVVATWASSSTTSSALEDTSRQGRCQPMPCSECGEPSTLARVA